LARFFASVPRFMGQVFAEGADDFAEVEDFGVCLQGRSRGTLKYAQPPVPMRYSVKTQSTPLLLCGTG